MPKGAPAKPVKPKPPAKPVKPKPPKKPSGGGGNPPSGSTPKPKPTASNRKPFDWGGLLGNTLKLGVGGYAVNQIIDAYKDVAAKAKQQGATGTPATQSSGNANAGGGEGQAPSGQDVVMNDTPANAGTGSTATQKEEPLWAKNQAYIQSEVDKGTGFIKPPAGYQGTATEFQNQNINSQLRDPNSPMSQALARMNRGTASARQASIDRESMMYGNVPMSSENRRLAGNNPVAYTDQSPSRGIVGRGSMPVNTSTAVGMNAANPNRAIPAGGASGRNAPLSMGMQSFSMPADPLSNQEMQRLGSIGAPQAEPPVTGSGPTMADEVKGQQEYYDMLMKDLENGLAGVGPSAGTSGVTGPAGESGPMGTDPLAQPLSEDQVDNGQQPNAQEPEVSPEEVKAQADWDNYMKFVNKGNMFTDMGESVATVGEDIQKGDWGAALKDGYNTFMQGKGLKYTGQYLGTGALAAKQLATMKGVNAARNVIGESGSTLARTYGPQAWRSAGNAVAQAAKSTGPLAVPKAMLKGGAELAGQAAGKYIPLATLLDAGIEGGKELAGGGPRSDYYKSRGAGAATAAANALTLGGWDTVLANYGDPDYAATMGVHKDPLGTGQLVESIYNAFQKPKPQRNPFAEKGYKLPPLMGY